MEGCSPTIAPVECFERGLSAPWPLVDVTIKRYHLLHAAKSLNTLTALKKVKTVER